MKTARLITARGLRLGLSEARRRYHRLAEIDPYHLPGQWQYLQQLCPKSGGDWARTHAFARETAEAAPPGSFGPVLVAEAHLEHWLEEHTRREEWLGGFKKDGERYTTLDGLKGHLGARFERVEEPRDLPFVIRETRRKFQHTLSQVTVWRRV